MSSFFFGEGRKAVVVESGGPRGFCHRPVDRAGGQYIANASAKIPTQIERSERAAMLGKMRSGNIQRNLAALQRGGNSIMRQMKQLGALMERELLHVSFLVWRCADRRFAGFGSADFRGGSGSGGRIMLWGQHRHLPAAPPVAASGDG